MSKKINRACCVFLWAAAIVLSVAGVLKTVYISADIDESYTVTMACRLIKGDRLFLDMWELHQTSAVLYAPFVWLFVKIKGSVIGLLVFLRIVGVCLQGLLAFYLYRAFRHYMGRSSAFFLSILFFNFTPKHIQSPEYSLLCCLGFALTTASFLQYYVKAQQKNSFLYLIAGALGLCVTILSYPAAIVLVVPFLMVLVYLTKKAFCQTAKDSRYFGQMKKNILLFLGTCAVCGMLFLLYVLSGISIEALIEAVSFVFMDESHKQNMAEHVLSHLQYLWDMLRITLPAVAICHVGRLVWRRWKKKDSMLFPLLLLLVQTGYGIVQFHTITDVNFLIFFPVILQVVVIGIYFFISYEKTEADKVLCYTVLPANFCLVLAVLFSSNLTANYSMSFLFLSVLVALFMIGRIFVRKEKTEEAGKGKEGIVPETEKKEMAGKVIWGLFAAVFVCMVFTSRIFLVRYTATQRINVFAPVYEAWHGVLSGVWLGDNDYRQYEWKTASLHEHVTDEDVFLYVGADMFLYGETDALIGTGNTISTPAFGEQLLTYYEQHPERIPTVIFVDCEYTMDYRIWLETEPFKSFIAEHYTEPIEEGPLYIYKKK